MVCEEKQGHQHSFQVWKSPAQQRTGALCAHLSNVSEYMYTLVNNTKNVFQETSKKSGNLGDDFGGGLNVIKTLFKYQ